MVVGGAAAGAAEGAFARTMASMTPAADGAPALGCGTEARSRQWSSRDPMRAQSAATSCTSLATAIIGFGCSLACLSPEGRCSSNRERSSARIWLDQPARRSVVSAHEIT